MTRAERLLYLTYASARATYGRFGYSVPSRFLQVDSGPSRCAVWVAAARSAPERQRALRDKVRGVSSARSPQPRGCSR